MILAIFTFFHVYFDPIYAYLCIIYWWWVGVYMVITYTSEFPIAWFLGLYQLFLWTCMHVYFALTYEIFRKGPGVCRKLAWSDLLSKVCMESRKTRYATYGIIAIYLLVFSIGCPAKVRESPEVTLMFTLTCIAMVIDIFLAIVKILLFLTWAVLIYSFSYVFAQRRNEIKCFTQRNLRKKFQKLKVVLS